MELTKEQREIITMNNSMVVSAGAGSGKSTTIIQHALARPVGEKKLILFFNKSMAEEMKVKAKNVGLTNTDILTSHSLAFRLSGVTRGKKIGNISPYDIVKLRKDLKVRDQSDIQIAYYAKQLHEEWAKSLHNNIEDIKENFFKSMSKVHPDGSEISFSKTDKKKILDIANQMNGWIDSGEVAMPHYYYLKRFQMKRIKLNYDWLYIDEFQDTSPVVLSIFTNQDHLKRVAIGDESQAIYAWNGAVDAMKSFPELPRLYLTQSFRFPQYIADDANEILSLKETVLGDEFAAKILMVGFDESKPNNLKAKIFRTNALALSTAFSDHTSETVHKPYFEGGFEKYLGGTISIYDYISLFFGKHDQIKSEYLKLFESFGEFHELCESVNDIESLFYIRLVGTYKERLSGLIRGMKSKCEKIKREDADCIYTTAHKSKGLEYGRVTCYGDLPFSLANHILDYGEKQFKTKESIEEFRVKLDQEINLNYMATTRSMKNISFYTYSGVVYDRYLPALENSMITAQHERERRADKRMVAEERKLLAKKRGKTPT